MVHGSIEYIITDIDYYEQDGLLHIGGSSFYFQFDKEAGPTIEQALEFILREQDPSHNFKK